MTRNLLLIGTSNVVGALIGMMSWNHLAQKWHLVQLSFTDAIFVMTLITLLWLPYLVYKIFLSPRSYNIKL